MKRRANAWITPAALCAFGLILRIGASLRFWVHGDEGIYYNVAHAAPGDARAIVALNAHPPLFYDVLRTLAQWSDSFGALRLPSIVCGTLAIAASFALAARLGGRSAGVAAGLLCAVAPGPILMSQVARPYALQLFLLALALWALIDFAERARRTSLGVYAVSMGLAVGTQYGTLIALAGVLFALAFDAPRGRWRSGRRWVLVLASLPALGWSLYLLWTHVLRNLWDSPMRARAQHGWLAHAYADGPEQALAGLRGVLEYTFGSPYAVPAAVCVACGAYASVRSRTWDVGSADARRWVAIALAVTLVVALALSGAGLYPLGPTRHATYLTPFLLAVAAQSVPFAIRAGHAVKWTLAVALAAAYFLGPYLGVARGLPHPRPELRIRTVEVARLVRRLEPLLDLRGVLMLDASAANTLSPLLLPVRHEDAQRFDRLGVFRWNNRHVVAVGTQPLRVAAGEIGERDHLATALESLKSAGFVVEPLHVLALRNNSIAARLRAVERRRRAHFVLGNQSTANFALLELSASAYLEAMRERTVEPDRKLDRRRN
jgi:hypothetical protein